MTEQVFDAEVVEESTGKELAMRAPASPAGLPRVRFQMDEIVAAIEELDHFKQKVMRPDIDYGVIPGVDKPSLLKPGAERLMHAFGFGSTVEKIDSIEDWDEGLFRYIYRAGVGPMINGVVAPIAWCEGSANSREIKYRYRNIPDFVATDEQKASASKSVEKESKNGKKYHMLTVENKEPFDLINTLQKMAQKRALVGAVLIATGTSGQFTQDAEDMPEYGHRSESKPQQSQPKPASSGKDEDMVLTFGKYKGQTLGAIAAENETYLPWLKGQLQKKADEGKLPADQMPLKDAVERICQ